MTLVLVLLVTVGNFAIGFGLAKLLGYGPKWRRPVLALSKRRPASSAAA
jgi:hypothetical protein